MKVIKSAASLAMAAVLGVAAQGLGQTTPTAPQATTASRPGGAALGIAEVVERLSREGYREVNEIKRKGDKLYKVSARGAQGRGLELYVDARTGEVLASEEEDD